MHEPRTLDEGVAAHCLEYSGLARSGRLVVYAGSGISRSDPAALQTGPDLAVSVFAHLDATINGMPSCDRNDLRAIGDAMDGVSGGLDALKHVLVTAAPFTTAPPNYGHRVLALLVLENLVSVITTNWDTCIERAAEPEIVPVIVSDIDRIGIQGSALLKLHGTASRPSSLLVTSAELDSPPPWVQPEVARVIASSAVLFVGVGDIPDHVRDSIDRVVTAVGNAEHVHVVAPAIASGWDASPWAAIISDLPEAHRIEALADPFLDDLARAIVGEELLAMRSAYQDDPDLLVAWDTTHSALSTFSAVTALRWLRDAGIAVPPGASVLLCPATALALVALGVLGGDSLELRPGGGANINHRDRFVVMIATRLQPMPQVRRAAQARLQRLLEQEGPGGDVKFLVANPGVRVRPAIAADLLSPGGSGDVVDGPLSSTAVMVDASEVLAR